MHLTMLGDDGSRLTIQAETLGAYATDEGTVVRARFPSINMEQRHHLIRLMFSDPNAWTGELYEHDRLTSAAVSVVTAPFRAIAYSLGFARPPAPPLVDAQENVRYKAVLQCYHCHGVLYRPMPICPHCGEPLMTMGEDGYEDHTDHMPAMVGERRRDTSGIATYVLPAVFVAAAIVLAFGFTEIVERPTASISQEQALQLKYKYVAKDAEKLAVQFEEAIETGETVPRDWGSKVANLRVEFPRAEDDLPTLYTEEDARSIARLLFKMHALEHDYRMSGKQADGSLRSELTGIRGDLVDLQ